MKRYRHYEHNCYFLESDDGEWVEYKDVKALEQITELNKKIDQAIKSFNKMEESFDLLNEELQEYISIYHQQ